MKKAAIALAVAAVTAISSMNISATASAETSNGNDYSRAGYGYVSVGAVELLENVLDVTLSASESEYLTAHSDFALKYNDGVAGKLVRSDFKQDTGELTVTPAPFFYKAVNGKTVNWQPVLINGEDISGSWSAVIDDSYTDDFVTVTYNTSFTVPYGDINGVLNLYYNQAENAYKKLEDKNAEYQTLYDDYQNRLREYDEYLEYRKGYEEQSAAYDKYLQDKFDWDIQDRLYQSYLAACAQYELDTKAYAEYEAAQREYIQRQALYQQYLIDKANYDEQYGEYLTKISDPRIAKELSHIEILDYLFTPVIIYGNNHRTLYNAVMGGSVTQVLSRLGEVNDDALFLAKLIRQPIDDAEKATKNLRDIFTKLNACKTDEDKYLLYIAAYDSLKENLTMLLQTLDYFFRNDFVRGQLKEYDGVSRDLQFQVMLAQLYSVCYALDNRATIGSYYKEHMDYYSQKNNSDKLYDFDSSYRIDGKTPAQLLGSVVLTDTNDAEPIDSYVHIPEEPNALDVVEEPVQPARVSQPVEPEKVNNPGPAPQVENDPGPPREEVLHPGDEPTEYQPTAEEQALADAFAEGNLSKRENLSTNYVYEAYCVVNHYFRNAQTLTVAFYLHADDQNCAWEEEDVQAGSSVEYGGSTPAMERRGYTCEFDGWQDSEGNPVDINNVPAAAGYLKLYPHFTETPNMYDVVWIINGVDYPAKAAYGSKPDYNDTYEGVPVKRHDEDGRQYRFTGWDRDMEVMTDQTIYYTAVFEKSCLVTFKSYSETYVISYWKGEMPECPDGDLQKPSNAQNYYTFGGWKNERGNIVSISPVEEDATYEAYFDARAILPLGANNKATVVLKNGTYYADCKMAASKTPLDISLIAEWAVGDGAGIILNLPTYSISFSADEVYLLRQSGAFTITPSAPVQFKSTSSGHGSYRFFVAISGKNGQTYDRSFTFAADYCYLDEAYSNLYRIDGDTKTEIGYAYSQNSVTFSMRAGYNYEIYPEYDVNILNEDTIRANVKSALENDPITITVKAPENGQFIQRVYYLDASGKQVLLIADENEEENEGYFYTFPLPEGGVTVGVIYGFYEYTVTFISEGTVIATRICRYGEDVVQPTPYKAPDGEYSYAFAGWDREVAEVTEDAVYVAQFSKQLLPAPESTELSQKMQILLWLANHLVLISVVAVILLALAVTGIIWGVKHRKKKRKTRQ